MKIPILVYHSINNNKSNLSLTINDFEKQLKFLNKSGFKTIGFDKIDKVITDRTLFEPEEAKKRAADVALKLANIHSLK